MAKSLLLTLLALSTVALSVLYAREVTQNRTLTAQVADLQARSTQQRAQIQAQTKAVADLVEEKSRIAAKSESRRQKLAAAQASAAAAAETPAAPQPVATPAVASEPTDDATAGGSPGATGKTKPPGAAGAMKDYLKNMMKDPAMRKMIRTGQAMGIKQMYGDLVRQWNLPPDQADTFYDQLLDKQMAAFDHAGTDSGGAGKSIAEATADQDAALKSSLGDEMYQQYKDYEKTVAERTQLSLFKQRLATDDVQSLTPDQSSYVLKVMNEERKNSPPGSMFALDSSTSSNGQMTFDKAAVDKFMQSQADLNTRVTDRLGGMLSTQQLDTLKKYQQQMLDMQKMGMEMSASMAGGKP